MAVGVEADRAWGVGEEDFEVVEVAAHLDVDGGQPFGEGPGHACELEDFGTLGRPSPPTDADRCKNAHMASWWSWPGSSSPRPSSSSAAPPMVSGSQTIGSQEEPWTTTPLRLREEAVDLRRSLAAAEPSRQGDLAASLHLRRILRKEIEQSRPRPVVEALTTYRLLAASAA